MRRTLSLWATGAPLVAAVLVESLAVSPPLPQAITPVTANSAVAVNRKRIGSPVVSVEVASGGDARGTSGAATQPARGDAGTPAVDDYGHDDRAADDDPFVVLVEVQRADGLTDQHDEQRTEHRADRAALAADQTCPADHRRCDHIELVALSVAGGRRPVQARAEKRRESRGQPGDRE